MIIQIFCGQNAVLYPKVDIFWGLVDICLIATHSMNLTDDLTDLWGPIQDKLLLIPHL